MSVDPQARDQARDAAWIEYQTEHGYLTKPTSPDVGADFDNGFERGWEATVAVLGSVTGTPDTTKHYHDSGRGPRGAGRNSLTYPPAEDDDPLTTREAVDRILGWKHLRHYSGMSEQWMDDTRDAIIREVLGTVTGTPEAVADAYDEGARATAQAAIIRENVHQVIARNPYRVGGEE
jgi:hypothetical protein